jgi:hypothetical protein
MADYRFPGIIVNVIKSSFLTQYIPNWRVCYRRVLSGLFQLMLTRLEAFFPLSLRFGNLFLELAVVMDRTP